MRRSLLWLFSSLAFSASAISYAAVTLVDKDDWKVQMSGFIESDMIRDSKRSFSEVEGNSPVDRPGVFKGENGRMQFSIRNSRLAFTVLPPQQGEWKSKGYFEFDLLGFDPAPGATNSESSYYTNATLRVRHGYLSAENDGWQLLAGQYWTLFGWQPTYVITASVPPGPGIVYQRSPQLTGMKTLMMGDNKLQAGVSVARPSQRDSAMPNLDAGAKFSMMGLTSGFASPSGDIKAEPLSVAVSGTVRQFATATSGAANAGMQKTAGSAFAVDAMVPVIPSRDGKDVGGTLTLTGEFSAGKGYGDAFPGWTGNLAQLPSGTAGTNSASDSNLDAGQGGYDSSGTFQLLKLQTWNTQLQYHLPGGRCFVTLGHSQLTASNINGLGPAASGAFLYDKSAMDFINFYHDFTPQIRGAIEYAKITTHYVDDIQANNDRYQVTAYFRF